MTQILFASTESDGYQPYLAELAWPLVTECLGRELISGGQGDPMRRRAEWNRIGVDCEILYRVG